MDSAIVLVVDDEEDILNLVEYNLLKNHYQVSCVATGEEAMQFVSKSKPDIIVLDLMLPEIDGLEVCRRLKQNEQYKEIPIIMLTAKGEERDVIKGLELGADDYITKPFSPKILIARLNAVLRRTQAIERDNPEEIVKIYELELHPGRFQALIQDKPVELTLTEFRIIHLLAKRPGWVFTRNQIIDSVQGSDYPVTDRSVDVQIFGLRKKIGECGNYIETVRGVGYRFKE